MKVYSFERALKRYPKALWINTSQKYRDEINTQLYKMGVLQNKIVVYFNKADSYYDLLDEQYKEYEEEQLILMKCGKKNSKSIWRKICEVFNFGSKWFYRQKFG